MSPSEGSVRQPRATLADVARSAGVSLSTASKALSGSSEVKEATKMRVMRTADELAYRPNRRAQLLSSGQSSAVGLLVHDLEGRFSIPIMIGAGELLGTDRMSALLSDARGDSVREQQQIDALLSDQVDGLIVVGHQPDSRPSLGALPVPVVYAYTPSDDPTDTSVVVDEVGSGRTATRHLLQCGRRKIAVITGDVTHAAARDRTTGALAELKAADLSVLGGDAFFGAWSEAWGRGASRTVLKRFPDVDGIVCGSDQIARGVLDTLREAGRRVPDDVAVIGNDNWRPIIEGSRPQLTSVDMCLDVLGRTSAELLLALIRGEQRQGIRRIESRLVVRESTA